MKPPKTKKAVAPDALHGNDEIGDLLEEIADLLELDGANMFRVRAYRNAAKTVRGLGEQHALDVKLTTLGGIGADLEGKIGDLARHGTTEVLEEARGKWPSGLRKLLGVKGLGPKRTKILYEELGVESLADLREVVDEGRVAEVPGLGLNLQNKLKETLAHGVVGGDGRFARADVEPIANDLVARIKALPSVWDAEVAGSFRRGKSTLGDLDIVAAGWDGAKVISAFTKMPRVREVLAAGATKGSVKLDNGLQVDLRLVDEESYGAALLYLTGPRQHSIRLRAAAIKLGYKLNEYGVFDGKKKLAGETEESMYDALGLPYLTPAQREKA